MEQRKRIVQDSKNSRSEQSSKLLKTLKRIEDGLGGSISYVFLQERTRFTKANPDGEVYHTKYMLHQSINPDIFHKMDNGKKERRSMQEVLQIFEDTKSDNGASYYIIG